MNETRVFQHRTRFGLVGLAIALAAVMLWGLTPQRASAVACLTAQSGSWNVLSTWGCGKVPDATDNVTIQTGHVVTLDQDRTANALTVQVGSVLDWNGYVLTLANPPTLSGEMRQTLPVDTAAPVDFLAIPSYDYGVSFDTTTTGSDLGPTTVTIRYNQTDCTQDVGDRVKVVKRCFIITPTNQLAAYVGFSFTTADMPAAMNPEDFGIYHWGGSSVGWEAVSVAEQNLVASPYQVYGTISAYSPFILADFNNTPTAVQLASMSGSSTPADNSPAYWIVGLGILAVLWGVWRSRATRAA
ncbi:MAG: G8 domain-containing protein [Thermoflexales bacterium]|nr:G8 domain-containing protein [Thermoflexales bacterium]